MYITGEHKMKNTNTNKKELEMKSLIKLSYTKKELKELGWATIGGRIEDFSLIAWLKGKAAAYKEIKKTYDEDYDDVYRGLIIYIEYGTNIYYTPRYL